MGNMKGLQGFDFPDDWAIWKAKVKERIAIAHRFGLPEETVRNIAVKVGDFLAEKGHPATKEEELLKEIWNVATPDEKETITTLIFRIAQ